MKAHGEVYDDDNSIKFPSRDISKSETVCAAKSSETKKDLATPKIIGSQKQDHWILDKKNRQLIRVHITPRKALFTPNPRNVQSILITLAESVLRKSLMRPKVEIQTF